MKDNIPPQSKTTRAIQKEGCTNKLNFVFTVKPVVSDIFMFGRECMANFIQKTPKEN